MRRQRNTRFRTKRWAAALVAGILAASASVLGVAAPSAASVAWAIAPASADGADGRISIRATLDPGQTVTEHVEISNLSDAPLAFALAGADGLITPDGDFDVLADGTVSSRAGRWIDVPAEVTVEARSSAVVPIAITVPADALPGDHPAGIVATPVRATTTTDDVAFIARTGVRLHLRVAGDISPALTPRVTALDYEPSWNPLEPGRLRVTWEVANTGNVRLGGTPTLSVSGLGGLVPQVEAERLEQFRELLPDGQRTGVTTVEAWPLFVLSADTAVIPTVVGDDVIDAALPAGAGSATVVTVPWVHLGLAAVIALAVVLLVRRVRRGDRKKSDAAASTPQNGEAAAD